MLTAMPAGGQSAFSDRARTLAWPAYWVVLVVVFIALRAKFSAPIVNVDEWIPLKLAEAMAARGALDPNWRLADLPDFLRYDQYNFYLYNVIAYVAIRLGALVSAGPLAALRLANLIFQLATLALSVDALRRIGAGRGALMLAGALIAVAPGMVQDASMARPESLTYLISALLIWVLTLPARLAVRTVLFGAVLGAGIAVKLSFASLAILMVVPWVIALRDGKRIDILLSAIVLVPAAALGFAVAAPYALVHADVYLNGIKVLAQQYAGAHPPHSLPVYSLGTQALWIARYFFELYGIAPLLALVAPFLLKGVLRVWAAGLFAAWAVLAVYFATRGVFFERNLAHGLVPLLLAAALGFSALNSNWLRVGALVLLLPMAYWSFQIADAVRRPWRNARFEAALSLPQVQRTSYGQNYGGDIPQQCSVIAVVDNNDPWSRAYLEKLRGAGFKEIARYRSRFSPLVTSTLHTYLDTDTVYFRCP